MREARLVHREGCNCACYAENIKNIKEFGSIKRPATAVSVSTNTTNQVAPPKNSDVGCGYEVVNINSIPTPDLNAVPVNADNIEYPSFEVLQSSQYADFDDGLISGRRKKAACWNQSSQKKCSNQRERTYQKI